MDTRLRTLLSFTIYPIVGCGCMCLAVSSIKIVDHPWLWHGVLTRMVVLEDRPRIVEE